MWVFFSNVPYTYGDTRRTLIGLLIECFTVPNKSNGVGFDNFETNAKRINCHYEKNPTHKYSDHTIRCNNYQNNPVKPRFAKLAPRQVKNLIWHALFWGGYLFCYLPSLFSMLIQRKMKSWLDFCFHFDCEPGLGGMLTSCFHSARCEPVRNCARSRVRKLDWVLIE